MEFESPRPDKLAVFEPTRRKVGDALRSRPHGYWTVDEIAERLGIHRTVAFDHLEVLVSLRIAAKVTLKGRRGRPANAYSYSGSTVEVSYPPTRHRLLAQVLARSAITAIEPRTLARDVGRTVREVDSLGGDYERDGVEIHARTCIFGSVCEEAQPLVCGVHAGLIEGASAASGEEIALTPLGPDGAGGCRYRLG